jgi:magnesium chelatase subunit D
MTSHLPFSAVVGQDDAKLALVLAAIEPRLGGVLLRGDKGSAKTTLARGLAALLPGGAPFVELPLGASEDRVVGALDVAALLDSRAHSFRPGLLAAAHGGVLYVDEVNLLADHLVDVLLDVAVSGVNRVERDGFSQTHPARFVLVGSMNPEEGELRPQLLDRFGLAVEVKAPEDPAVRAEIVRRQLAFESTGASDPSPDEQIRRSLTSARPAPCDDAVVVAAAELAVAVGAQGLRADLALCRAAGALAGLEGARVAGPGHLRRVAPLVLGHRRRRDPFEAPGIASDELHTALDQVLGEAQAQAQGQGQGQGQAQAQAQGQGQGASSERDAGSQPGTRRDDAPGRDDAPEPEDGSRSGGSEGSEAPDQPGGRRAAMPDPPDARHVEVDAQQLTLPRPPGAGTRTPGAAGHGAAAGGGARGRRIGHVALSDPAQRVDGAATATAYVTRTVREGRRPGGDGGPGGPGGEGGRGGPGGEGLAAGDLRATVTADPQATLVIVAVDTSGSIAGRRRLDAARAAVMSLLGDAYRRRDRVAMVAFRGESAEVVLRPTGSVEVARARLAELPSGGRTPLAAGLHEVTSLVRAAQRPGGPRPVVVLVTDGRATAGGDDPLEAANAAAAELASTGVACLVVDAETGPVRLGLARSLAATLSAGYVLLEDIERPAEGLAEWPAEGAVLADTIRARVRASATER